MVSLRIRLDQASSPATEDKSRNDMAWLGGLATHFHTKYSHDADSLDAKYHLPPATINLTQMLCMSTRWTRHLSEH
jgi:hypothetical protein